MSKITKKVYPVMGMHCAACANNVEKIVKKQEGKEDASVNLAAAVLTVDFNSDVVSPEQLKDSIRLREIPGLEIQGKQACHHRLICRLVRTLPHGGSHYEGTGQRVCR